MNMTDSMSSILVPQGLVMLAMPQGKSHAELAGGVPPWRQGIRAGKFVRRAEVESMPARDLGSRVPFCLLSVVKGNIGKV